MAYKLQKISELANKTAQAVMRDANGWMRYLDTASRLYKYPFDEQLLIYAQRPDATACASMELWNGTMRRWIKPGSKGIAIIRKDRRGKPGLEYVYDYADTRPVRGAREPYLWQMRKEHHPAVLAALEQRYGPAAKGDIGDQIMELARHAVDEVYHDRLSDLAYDTKDSLLEELDELNLEVRFRRLLATSVQYTLLTRCGLDPLDYLDDEDFDGISEFSTPTVLHHLGNAASAVSMEALMEIGTAIRQYEQTQAKNNQKISEKPLAKKPQTGYTTTRGQFNTVKRESAERSDTDGGSDLHEGGRLLAARSGDGRRGRTGGNAAGQVRNAAGGLSEGASQRDIHLHASDGQADRSPSGDRPAGAGAGGQHREGPDEKPGRKRGIESQGSDGVGTGGERLHPSGGGNGAGGDRLQVNQEQREAAGEQPAASASPEPEAKTKEAPAPELARFSLFPTVEEQVEAIAEAQAEEKRQTEIDASSVHSVSDAVVDRILTSGGNSRHSIERIVAFFQKNPSNEDAAAFLEKEYGVGGKGLTVARTKYAMWFDEKGIHVCPGNNTYGTVSTHLPWAAAAIRISRLLKDGMFASQEKIDTARENELDSLANRLTNLRANFSDAAKEKDYLHTVSEAYGGSRSGESALRVRELLREPESRRRVLSELRAFASFYVTDRTLLTSRPATSLPELTRQIADLDKPITEFKAAIDGFAPAKATFITEDEIDQFLMGAFSFEGSRIRVYSYFMQGHDAKECAAFLRHECGDAGHTSEKLTTWSDGKGIKFTRFAEDSGADGYDTVHLNWNQAQKRIRDLIEKGRYLTRQERESLPEHDMTHLAQMLYHFFSHVPDCQHRPFADGADAAEAAKQIIPLLETPEIASKLFDTMLSDFATISPDAEGYTGMMFAMRDMGAFVRGDSPLFTPLPESALQAEREVKERNRKKGQPAQEAAVTDTPGEASGELAAVARALASKRKPEAEAQGDGQFSLFSSGQTAEAEPQEQREISDMDLDHFLIEDLGDPERKQRLYALFTEGWSDAIIVRKLEQEYSRSRHGNLEGGFCTLADGTRGYAYFAKELRISPRPEGKMRHVSFEEMAAHIRQLIQENRYLSPEELERYQKEHTALEPEAPKAEAEKKYRLGYGHLGNGLTVWNSMEMEDGDYKIIAHIAPDRTVTFYADDLPEEIKREIQHTAATSDARISATQDAPVFSTPPQVPELEQETSRSPWWDEYTALKANYPNHLVLYQVGDFFELFGEDAKNAAAVLGLELTTRPIGGVGRVEMCGLPAHALEQNVERLRGQYDVAVSTFDEKTGAYQARTLAALDSDTVPYNFEFEYRQLSRLKSDCDYFLGAGGRHEGHLSEGGSITKQIARMRELYGLLPEKPEWLTAEDIDRYEAEMTGAEPGKQAAEQNEAPAPAGEATAAVQSSTHEITVMAEEVTLFARLMSNEGITPGRIDHENGDVTFSVAESEKDTAERLITTLRKRISRAVAAASKPKKARRTRPEINYSAFEKLFPEIISGEYRSMRLQAGQSFMPLHVEWIADDVVALGHTYQQNGDTMNDPEMTFRVDREKGTLEALTFQQDGGIPIYQEVYPEPGKWIPKLRSDLNTFAAQWMKNITAQKYIKEKAVSERDGEDVEVFFSPEGAPLTAYDILMRESDTIIAQLLNDESYANARRDSDEQNSRDECLSAISRIVAPMVETNIQFYKVYFDAPLAAQQFRDYLFETTYQQDMAAEQVPVSSVTLYREALSLLVGAVRGSSFYDYLRDQETDYDSARDELDAEITTMMEEIKEENPALYEAYHTRPKFREWLVEDILEQTYQDVTTDARDAVQRYAGTPDAPAWIQEDAPAQPEQDTREEAAPEEIAETRDPLIPAYQEGDTVYIRDRAFVVKKVEESSVLLQDQSHTLPIYERYGKEAFARELSKDSRNNDIAPFLSANLPDVNPILREALIGDGGLLELRDKAVIAGYIQAGEDNLEIAQRLANTYEGIVGTVTLWTGNQADYSANSSGFEVHIHDDRDSTVSMTWNLIAPILRTLYQQELDGFLHEPPAEGHLQGQAEAGTNTPQVPEAGPEPTGAGAPENAEIVWHTPGGKEYRAGDTVEYFVDGMPCQIIIDSIGRDYVYYTFPDLPQAPAEMFRDKFERFLDDGSHFIVHEASEHPQQAPAEPSLAPNVDEYINLKAQYPDKLVGVQVGDYMLFYGKDAEEAAPALGRDVLTREIPGLGETGVTGYNGAWQAALKKLLEHGKSVVLARPDLQRGPDAPYEIIKERDISEYIPLGKELDIDGRRMKVDSIDYANGKVSLMDMELTMEYRYPVFREEPVAFVREYVEEAEQREFEQAARVEEIAEAGPPPEQAPDHDIPVGTVLTVNGHRMKIDSVDTARDEVMLLDLDARGGPPMFSVKSGDTVRGLLAEAPATDAPAPPEGQHHAGADELEEAKRLIEDFCDAEYGGGVDFSDLKHIGIAYTNTEDEQHEIQVEVNLLDFSVTQTLDGQFVEQRRYKTLRELIDNELAVLSFDDLVYVEGEPEELLASALKAAQKPEPAPEPERVEIDGGRITKPPTPKTPMTSKVVGRVNAGAFDVIFEELHFGPELHNFHITDEDLGAGGQKTKYQNNVAAIRTLKQIEADGRLATPEEQEILSRYVGWGSLAPAFDERNSAWAKEYAELQSLLTPEEYAAARATTLNAHYTSPRVIKAIYDAVERMGFQPGNVLEPSCGIGNFFGLLPETLSGANLYGVELDGLTGRIARQLYQKANITVNGFENTDHPDDFFDLAVGNVPFGSYKVHDRRYDRHNLQIHDYFLMKTLDKLRPGGIMAVITSKGTMDKKNSKVREALAQKANLLGAIRLPNNAFKANAGTEVTSDILFFQKRATVPEKLPEWVESGLTTDGVPLNQYYLQHPEMVLGTMALGKSMYGNDTETACYPVEGADLAEQLAGAVAHIDPPDRELLDMDVPEQEDGTAVESIPADPNVRNFSYTVSKGNIYFRENSRMVPVELGKVPTARVKGMIGIRDSTRKLIDLQLKGASDAEIKAEQANLNRLYDAYTKKYGILNSAGNRLAFNQDSSYPLLCSLEVLDDEGNFKQKADMFTKRTIQHHEAVTSVDTAAEALAVSIGERACVDLGFMASLMGGGDKIPQIVKDLKGVIFKDPDTGPFDIDGDAVSWYKGWQTADEYLSGDVRAKLAKARTAAEEYPEFAVNAEALEQVQPKDLTAAEISVRIGAPWVKPEYYREFIFELLQVPEYLRDGKIDVFYNKVTGEWNVKGKSEDKRDNPRIRATYGTKRRSAYVIFENLLNQRDTRVYDEDAEGKRTLNARQTTIAQQKAEAIDQAFRDWIFKDPERRADLCATYNRIFNSKRPREYNGDHIAFAGMNPEYKLEPHQRNAVARMLYGGNSLLAHCVGAGKTFEMTAAAMEGKRLGLCQKSLFVVPNHLTEQWGSDFLTLYPGAKVLVATKKDFQPKNRKKFCARIATGDYDAVIIGHSQFEKIPLSPERQAQVIEDQISEIMDAIREAKAQKEENWSIKQMEGTRKDLEAKLKKLTDKKKDDTVTFEELGIDRLFVDEAHYYKNLFLHTKMRNVAGISQTEAQKSSDMFGKCRYLDELTGGRGVTFATGTPVSNSMVELYTMMRYLQFDMLEEAGLSHFDDWAAMFGEKVSAVELKPEGTGFRSKTRFARFYNLPELMNLWKEAADIQTAEMLNLPVPEAEYITVTTEPSAAQKEMVQSLAKRAEAVRNGMVKPNEDNMLKITSDGRKLALDQRIMNPLLGDDPNSKVNACVKNILTEWHNSMDIRGTQLVFCDLSTPKGRSESKKPRKSIVKKIIEKVMGENPDEVEEDAEGVKLELSVYSDIREKLIAKGVPAEEIAFIHDAHTEAQKAELFAKVRSGQVRVLLGSTQKMGAGTNVQKWLVASHDLDCPWRPADLEQRAGRIVRRGNKNKKVRIYRYVTKGTFDAYNWGLVENKQKFIGQIMTGKSPARSIEDVDATALSYAEVKMLATGDPRIKEKMELDIEVAKLKMLKANHMAQKYEMEDMVIKHYPQKMAEARMFIRALTEDMQIRDMHPVRDDAFSMTVCGKTYSERKAAGEAILAACKSMTDPDKPLDLGQFRGFPMQVQLKGEKFIVSMKQNLTYTAELADEPLGNVIRISNALEKIADNLENQKRSLVTLEGNLENAKEEASRPFPQEEELATKSARLSELNAELDNDGKERDQGNDAEPEQEDGEVPPRANPVPPIAEGDKPSIRAALRSYTPPAPVAAGAERIHYRGEAL